MAAYRADQQEKYGVTKWKNVKAAVFKVQQFVTGPGKVTNYFRIYYPLPDRCFSVRKQQ
jgi:hypothetical protein